eukprot:scaffold653334_cov57-Prasinocladus_malaysianus.AAC.1
MIVGPEDGSRLYFMPTLFVRYTCVSGEHLDMQIEHRHVSALFSSSSRPGLRSVLTELLYQ